MRWLRGCIAPRYRALPHRGRPRAMRGLPPGAIATAAELSHQETPPRRDASSVHGSPRSDASDPLPPVHRHAAVTEMFAHLWSSWLSLRLLADDRSVVEPAVDGCSVVEQHPRRVALAVRVDDAELVVRSVRRPGEFRIAPRIPGQHAIGGQTIALGENAAGQLFRFRLRDRGVRHRAGKDLDVLEASIVRGQLNERNRRARILEDRHQVIVPRASVGEHAVHEDGWAWHGTGERIPGRRVLVDAGSDERIPQAMLSLFCIHLAVAGMDDPGSLLNGGLQGGVRRPHRWLEHQQVLVVVWIKLW